MTDPVLPFVPRRLARVATDALRLATTLPLGEPLVGMDPTVPANIGRLFMGDGATPGGLGVAFLSELQAEITRAKAAEAALVGGIAPLSTPPGRLTLTSGVAVTTSDVAAATTLFYTPAAGSLLWLFNGTAWVGKVMSEMSLALSATYHPSGSVFDAFVFLNNGALAIGSGPAWASALTRGTGAGTTELQPVGGLPVNKNGMTIRIGPNVGDTVTVAAQNALWLGSFACGVAGGIYDTQSRRHLYNAYNQAVRPFKISDPATSWTYSSAAWRVANGNGLNLVGVLNGWGGLTIEAESIAAVSTSGVNANAYTGIGIDSQTLNAADCDFTVLNSPTVGRTIRSRYRGPLSVGLHTINWLEYGFGSDTQTWFGTNNNTSAWWTGLRGSYFG